MYKNLFAACLVISIGFHIIIAAFIISHKPVPKNISNVSVQQVSLVGNIKSGLKAIERAKANKPVWDIPSPKQEETVSGLESMHLGTNSFDTPKPFDAKTDNSSERSELGNISEPSSAEEGGKGSPASGLSGIGAGRGKGEDKRIPADSTGTGTQNSIIKARLVNQPNIRYYEEGSVGILLEIDSSGNPGNVRITESSGYPRLDSAVRKGIRSSRFSPTLKDGRPVKSEVEYKFVFLKGEKSTMKIDEDSNVKILE